MAHTPPVAVRRAALRGLKLRRKYGRGGLSTQEAGKQGIGSGVRRATDLANGRAVSNETIRRMSAFFSRHQKNFRPDKKETDGGPTAGTIAYYLWGGPSAKKWVDSIMSKTEKEKITKRVGGVDLPASSFLVVEDGKRPSTWHLPVKDADGNLDRGRMGAARAALGPGYRGQKYQGPQKALAKAKLMRLYAQAERESKKTVSKQCSICGDEATESLHNATGGKFVSKESKLAVCEKCGERMRKLTTKPGGKTPGSSIKNPKVYEALIKQGYSKERAARISNAMVSPSKTKETAVTTKETSSISLLDRAKILQNNGQSSSFVIYKQADGRYRWVTRSSNAFRDRDGEIVSVKALSDDVARADKDGDYGPLRFWHMPGVDIGDTDFNYMYKRTLIESGTFRDPAVAEKVASKAANYQISIGFRHPTNQPDENGVFHQIRRFERSLVPAGRAANPFTSLSVHKEKAMDDTIKQAALKALLDGDEAQLKGILAGADSSEKTADSMGIAFKESGIDLNDLNPDQLLEFAVQQKEAQLNAVETPAEGETEKMEKPKEDEPKKSPMEDYTTKMGGYMEKMGGYMDRMEKMFGKSEKAADDLTAVNGAVNAHSTRLAQTEATIKELSNKLESAMKELSELKSDVPAGLGEGVKPTERTDNIVSSQQNGQTTKGYDDFMSFVVEKEPN